MKRNEIKKLLMDALGSSLVLVIDQGNWVMTNCPFASYDKAHRNSIDEHPSFGVHVNDIGNSIFN